MHMNPYYEDRSGPFRLALAFAIAGVVLCAAGFAGVDLGMGTLLSAQDYRGDDIIWWEVYFGGGFSLGAVFFGTMANRVARRS